MTNQSISGREIGELPPIGQIDRRLHSQRNLRYFCETYFPQQFSPPLAHHHRYVLRRLERFVLEGQRFAFHIQTGSSIPEYAGLKEALIVTALWGILHGHRSYLCLVAASQTAAQRMLDQAWHWLETNPLLAEDFPETCIPIRRRDGIRQRRITFRGEPIRFELGRSLHVLPRLDSFPREAFLAASGNINLRGLRPIESDGKILIADYLWADDPDDESDAEQRVAMRARLTHMREKLGSEPPTVP